MYEVVRQISFCYGHRLLNYNGKCRHLHGHNGLVEIVLATGELNHLGMVADFSDIKKVVAVWLDDTLDHRMILHKDDPILPVLLQLDEPVHVIDVNPTAENIARLIFDHVASIGYPVIQVKLWETPSCFAVYRSV